MPHIDSMKVSNYLKKEDVGNGTTVTIKQVSHENIAKQGSPEEMKWLIYFHEFKKPLVSNSVNRDMIAYYTGSPMTEDWIGKQIVLWNDPSVTFGAIRGGIRVKQASPVSTAHNQPDPPFDDDIPDFGQ